MFGHQGWPTFICELIGRRLGCSHPLMADRTDFQSSFPNRNIPNISSSLLQFYLSCFCTTRLQLTSFFLPFCFSLSFLYNFLVSVYHEMLHTDHGQRDADIYIVYFIALSYPIEYHVSFDLCGLIPSTSVCKVGSSSYICLGEPGLAITVHHQTSIDSPFLWGLSRGTRPVCGLMDEQHHRVMHPSLASSHAPLS